MAMTVLWFGDALNFSRALAPIRDPGHHVTRMMPARQPSTSNTRCDDLLLNHPSPNMRDETQFSFH
jgi:hypothetical protein